ncbi:sulfurtransferase [Endothiovibrio diazotrophicus]
MSDLPLIIEPDALERRLGEEGLLIVDLCRADLYARFHIPGAIHLDYGALVSGIQPATGELPAEERLAEVLGGIGLTPESRVVAYDDEGGGKAGRLLWTLDVIGHSRASLLNGGIASWSTEQHPMDGHAVGREVRELEVVYGEERVADMGYVLERLHDPDVVLLDARSPEEYRGRVRYALRGGHIPGAVNIDWMEAMDTNRNLRLKPEETLRALFEGAGVTPDKEVIVYCQTHHRSSHTYMALKSLGYPRLRGYAGAWADWGNNMDAPIER